MRPVRVIALLLGMLSWAAVAGAQASQEEYQQLVQQGLHEYEVGNFVEAKVFFQRAHRLSPSARTLRGLGMVSYELRRYVEAVEFLKQALASEERPLTADMQQEVTQLLRQALTFVTWLDLSVSPQQAEVHVDARGVSREADGRIMLDPGSHELLIEAPGYIAVTRTIRSDGADTLSLSIQLPAQRQQPAPVPVAAGSGVGPYVLMGSSAALAVAGGILLAVALDHKHAVENPPDGSTYPGYQSKADAVLPLSAAGIAGLSAGGAGMLAGLIWKLASGDAAPEERAPHTRLTVTGTGIALESRFP
jgi:tetratricopeptide (TPR) repeat protein